MNKKIFNILLVSLSLILALPAHSVAGMARRKFSSSPKMDSAIAELVAEHKLKGKRGGEEFAARRGIKLKDDRVRIVLVLEKGAELDPKKLSSMDVRVRSRYRDNVEAESPVDRIGALSLLPQVMRVRLPCFSALLAVESEGVSLTGASALHGDGFTGQNTKVAIIDQGFIGIASAQAAGDLPSDWGVRITTAIFDGSSTVEEDTNHGTACAEVVHDMAPDAHLYLLKISSGENELASAVAYCHDNGIDIISHSVGWFNSGPGDGTGDICDIAYDARVSSGILWVNSSGNHARRHWEGDFLDSDGNGIHNFTPYDETINLYALAGEKIQITLRWSATSWTYCDQDFDLYLLRSTSTVAASFNSQTGPGCSPAEAISYVAPYSGWYEVAIDSWDVTSPHILELYSLNHDFSQYAVASSSILEPADSGKVVACGAVNHNNWTAGPQENFSSLGPTNDNRIKPDMAGPDAVANFTYSGGFFGTSASAPHIAGAAAVLLSRNPSWTADDLESALAMNAIDMGVFGKDNVYGYGRLSLDRVPSPINPLCEGKTNPVDVTDYTPEFSWTFADQSAYQIIVASSAALISADAGSMWSSGKMSTSVSSAAYAGAALSGHATYYWKVKAWNIAGSSSPYCAAQTFSMKNNPVAAPTGPLCNGYTNPTGIDMESLPPAFSWTFSDPDYVDYQTGYRVLVASVAADIDSSIGRMWDTNRVWSSLSSDIPYAGASLAFGTTYYWKAMTWSNDGSSSPYCSAQTFKTTTRPTSFSGVAVSTHSIMWTWHDNCNDACSYEVYAGTSALSGALGQDTTSWQEKGLISNTRYTRHVRITGPDGELSSDAGTRYTLANPPQNLTALADDIGDHRVTLQWSGEGGSRFGVARSSSSGTGPWTWIAGWPDNITRSAYTDEDAIFANTTYWYRVRGYNGDGIATTPTAVISVLTKPDVTAPLPPVITISLLPGETGIRRNGTIIIGGSANGEPELVISRVKVFDQDGNELTLGVEQIDVRIGWTDGIISGYIIIGDIKKHYPMVTAITIQVEIEDDNGAGYHFFVTGQSNALAISGESIRLNAYENLINPINGDRTYIRIELVEDCNVTLRVCNLAGDTVRTIINSQPMYAGVHTGSTWDGRNEQGDNVASGIYLLYLDAGGRKQWKKVAVIKE